MSWLDCGKLALCAGCVLCIIGVVVWLYVMREIAKANKDLLWKCEEFDKEWEARQRSLMGEWKWRQKQ